MRYSLFRENSWIGIICRPFIQIWQWTIVIGIVHFAHYERSFIFRLRVFARQAICNAFINWNNFTAIFKATRIFLELFEKKLLTLLISVVSDSCGNLYGALFDGAERRVDAPAFQVLFRHVIRDGLRRNEEKFFPNMMDTRCYDAQSDTWENVSVVALARLVRFAIVLHFAEGRARGKYTASLKSKENCFRCFDIKV